jgi:hypothetical protein
MDITILYVEIFVSFLTAIIVYVLAELFNIENDETRSDETRPTINFPRFAIWMLCVGIILVVIAWLSAFGINIAEKHTAISEEYATRLNFTAKWLFYLGAIACATSMLAFGYKAAVHPRSAAWFSRAGMASIMIGLLSFCASTAVGYIVNVIHSGKSPLRSEGLAAGLLNPFFFIGIPLGFYWLYRSKQLSVLRTNKR